MEKPYGGRTLAEAMAEAKYNEETLPHLTARHPSEWDRVILAQEIERLRSELAELEEFIFEVVEEDLL